MRVVEFESVVRKYEDFVALNNVSFQINEGEIWGFLGPNGAGKTTTIRLILNLLEPNSGNIWVFGKNLKDPQEAIDSRKKIGFALDNPGHFVYSSAWRNLMYYATLYKIKEPKERIENLLKEFELWDVRESRVETFSKGMKQRLSLCRAFLNSPHLLILDEPTSGLDPSAQRNLKSLIKEKAIENKCTVFFSSHNLAEVENICTNVALLNKGKMVFNDTLSELKRKYSVPRVGFEIVNVKEEILKDLANQYYVVDVRKKGMETIVSLKEDQNSHDLMRYLLDSNIRFKNFRELSPTLDEIYEKEVERNE